MKRKPWAIRDGEKTTDYARFQVYLELGVTRSLSKASEALTSQGASGASPGRLEELCTAHDWVARCRAFDEKQATKRMGRIEANRAAAIDYLSANLMKVVEAHVASALDEGTSGPMVSAQKSILAANGIDSSSRTVTLAGGADGAASAIERAANALGGTAAELADRHRRRAQQEPGRLLGEGDGG